MEPNLDSFPSDMDEYIAWKEQAIRRQEQLQQIAERNERAIASLMSLDRPIQLELGAGRGRKRPGWTTVDWDEDSDLVLDLRAPLPFPNESVTQIYSSHVLEHFAYPQPMTALLSECYRILKKDGIFSACVPNARIYIEGYLHPEEFAAEQLCDFKPAYHYHAPIDYINYVAYMGGHHHFLFDEKNLLVILEAIGFRNARLRDFNPELDLEARRIHSIHAIAQK